MQSEQNRFGYVGGNSTTMIDPSGRHPCAEPELNCAYSVDVCGRHVAMLKGAKELACLRLVAG